MPTFPRDGITFHFREAGRGVPFVFQHGLGGDVSQPFGLLDPPPAGYRLIGMDFRAHGESRPTGDEAKLGIAAFADDLAALLDHLGLDLAVIGGISQGAAVALNFALRFPNRVLGLILSRPAWLDAPFPENVRIFPVLARLIRDHGARRGLELFEASPDYKAVLDVSPDNAAGLAGQFTSPRAEDAVARLERIPRDTPSLDREEWRAIRVPTLVLANRQDPIHPFAYGEVLAAAIPGATFAELTPKSVSLDDHAADVRRAIEAFLRAQFPHGAPPPC